MKFIRKYQSPNYNDRPSKITHIILHYTDLKNASESISILCDSEKKVSAHYLIDYNGHIYELVSPKYRAWHAGVSSWNGVDNVNDYSIGIELQNKGQTVNFTESYPQPQMHALLKLLSFLVTKYNIAQENIIGHQHIAPSRKIDPGPHFNWKWLKTKGFGGARI